MPKVPIQIRRMVILDKLAPRYGFTLQRGLWVRQWSSGKQWYMDQFGEYCGIYDEHGRIIRHSSRDLISCIGMLAYLHQWRRESQSE